MKFESIENVEIGYWKGLLQNFFALSFVVGPKSRTSYLNNNSSRENWTRAVKKCKFFNEENCYLQKLTMFVESFAGRWICCNTKMSFRLLTGIIEFNPCPPLLRTVEYNKLKGLLASYVTVIPRYWILLKLLVIFLYFFKDLVINWQLLQPTQSRWCFTFPSICSIINTSDAAESSKIYDPTKLHSKEYLQMASTKYESITSFSQHGVRVPTTLRDIWPNST